MGMKTLLAFEWLEQNCEYDYVVRPTPSSYINHDNLVNFIKSNLLDDEYIYAENCKPLTISTKSLLILLVVQLYFE